MISSLRIFIFSAAFLFLSSYALAADRFDVVNKDVLIEKIRAHSGKSVVVFWAPW